MFLSLLLLLSLVATASAQRISASSSASLYIHNGTVWATGIVSNYFNHTPGTVYSPVPVPLPAGVSHDKIKRIVPGLNYVFLQTVDDVYYGYGYNYHNELGVVGFVSGSLASGERAKLVPDGLSVVHVSTITSNTFAIASDGSLYCLGLAMGCGVNITTYAAVTSPTRVMLPEGTRVKSVSSGSGWHACAIDDEDRLYCCASSLFNFTEP